MAFKVLTAVALLAATTPAYADAFQNREVAYQVLNVADAVQTCALTAKGYRELNPLIGSNPSCGKVIGVKVGFGVLHYVISRALEDRNPDAAKVFQIATIVVQGGVVAANLRFVF